MNDDDTTTASTAGEPPRARRSRKGPDPDLIARMTALGAQTGQAAPAEPAAERPARRTRKTKPVTAARTDNADNSPQEEAPRRAPARKPAAAMPAEQPRPATYSERINLTTTPEQNRALNLARVEDGIDKTARLRAMIALWEKDERLRRRINKEAKGWR